MYWVRQNKYDHYILGCKKSGCAVCNEPTDPLMRIIFTQIMLSRAFQIGIRASHSKEQLKSKRLQRKANRYKKEKAKNSCSV
jgi:hypothetical protein